MESGCITRRSFLGAATIFTGMALSGCVTGGTEIIPPSGTGPSYVSRLRVGKPGRIRVLQMTDIHLFAGEAPFWEATNKKTVNDLRALVSGTDPDLVMFTGDLWRDYPPEKLDEFARYAIGECGGLGVPWAYVWGNHDQVGDRAAVETLLTNAPNSLYRGASTNGNYVLNLEDRHGLTDPVFL